MRKFLLALFPHRDRVPAGLQRQGFVFVSRRGTSSALLEDLLEDMAQQVGLDTRPSFPPPYPPASPHLRLLLSHLLSPLRTHPLTHLLPPPPSPKRPQQQGLTKFVSLFFSLVGRHVVAWRSRWCAAWSRCQRRLRQHGRHEQLTLRMALAAALHHSCDVGPTPHDALRSQKTATVETEFHAMSEDSVEKGHWVAATKPARAAGLWLDGTVSHARLRVRVSMFPSCTGLKRWLKCRHSYHRCTTRWTSSICRTR